jgi:hypothetical protein
MKLYASATNTTGIISAQVNNSHTAQTAVAQIEAINTTLDIGSYVELDLGYTDNHLKVFSGYVKYIELKEPTKTYSITASDVLVRAMDYFIAASNPDAPLNYKNIKAETLVGNVLSQAGLTNYVGDSTLFTFGINNSFDVNLTSSYDYARFICDILSYNIYADLNGQIHFTRRLPYVVPGDVSIGTITTSNSISMAYSKTDKDLRNRVVVYGAEGIHAEASAVSPYLPGGFYKSVVVAAPTVFDNQGMAQQSADYNLELLNKLTESVSLTMIGNPLIQPRQVATVVNTSLGVSGDWYIYSVSHTLNNSGYQTQVELRR